MRSVPSKSDFLASIGVFAIALPLSLGIALASGAPIQSAVIAAVVGGVVVGAFAGAPLAVTGPAAGLTVIVFDIIRTQGFKGLAIATIVCGMLQLIMGGLKLGRIFKHLPHSILDGMLAAIGAMIALGQVFVAVGKPIPNGFLQSLAMMPSVIEDTFKGIQTTSPSVIGLVVAAGTIGVQLLWEKKFRRFSFVPGAVVAIATMTLLTLHLDLGRVSLNLSMSSLVSGISMPVLSMTSSMTSAVLSGVLLASIGSIESLATASGLSLYAKKMKDIDLPIDLNKELKAQGLGNIVSGLLGGLPLTAVIVRSAANIQFGATSRWSSVFHGIWILGAVLFLAPVLNQIPLSSLAAVLIVTGYRLVNIAVLKEYFQKSQSSAAIYVVTFFGILSTNLLKGIALGVLLAALFAIRSKMRVAAHSTELQI